MRRWQHVKEDVLLDSKKSAGLIGELLEIWILLDDVGRNGWIIPKYSVKKEAIDPERRQNLNTYRESDSQSPRFIIIIDPTPNWCYSNRKASMYL